MKGVKFMTEKEKLELFHKLSNPLMKFIRENGTPHDSIFITGDFAEYNTSQFGVPFETYCNRQQEIQCEICKNPMKSDKGCDGSCRF